MNLNCVSYNNYNDRGYFELAKGQQPWHVFLLITKGSFTFSANGKDFTVNANEIAFFPANTLFTRQVVNPINFHQLAFTIDEEDNFFKSVELGKLQIPKGHVKCIAESLSATNLLSEDKNDVYLHTIKTIIIENHVYKNALSSPKNAYPEDISAVIEHMSDNLDGDINMPNMARLINLSHVGLIWKFRKFVGSTPSQYLIAMRMRTAKNLLLDSNLAIKEIAVRCGYDNPYYFSNAFSSFFGTSPSKFRKTSI